MFANCHLHSTYSDGIYTPAQLVALAKQVGHRAVVLTDHDTVKGIHLMQKEARRAGLYSLLGCEFIVKGLDTGFHLLGYDFDPENAAMRELIEHTSSRHRERCHLLFEQGLTLEDIRGKLLIVVRPTQNDEDTEQDWTNVMNNITGVNADRVLVINGCGTGKDKWGARGYTINGERAYDLSNDHGTGSDIMEYHMQQGVYLSPTESTSPVAKGDPQFGYGTNHPKINCWFQEWARVVGENVRSTATTPNTYWFESYNEKLANVTATFSMAISGEYSNYVFINSLCGYLAGSDFTESIKPSCDNVSGQNKYGGAGGNIKALADKLNPDFYDYVLHSGLQQTTGPTGVVLIDYVSDDPSSAAYALPGTIIANNFKHSISGGEDVEGGEGDEGDENGGGL